MSPLEAGAGEIGRALREARGRLGLQLSAAEDATHIRAAYLEALEREQFERLPGRAYTRSFLREYAEFLGLDPQPLLTAFGDLVPEHETPALQPVGIERPAPIRRHLVALALGGLVLLLIGLAAWRLAGGHKAPLSRPRTHPQAAAPSPRPRPQRHTEQPPAAAIQLVLRASGPCWLWIRAGSTLGPVVYDGTLTAGRTLRYTLTPRRQRLWVRIGAPWNLAVLLDGRSASGLPPGPGNILITRHGIEPG